MLLEHLSSINCLSSLLAPFNNLQLSQIQALNALIEVAIATKDKTNHKLLTQCLVDICRSSFTSQHDLADRFITDLVSIYLEKIIQYVDTTCILSRAHYEAAQISCYSGAMPSHDDLINRWCRIDFLDWVSENALLEFNNIKESLYQLETKGSLFPVIDLGSGAGCMQEIAQVLEKHYLSELRQLVRVGANPKVRVAGQAKLHPPGRDASSGKWHLDGDPRWLKLILYLDDVPDNDGALRLAPWELNGIIHPEDHFGRCNLMIALSAKAEILRRNNMRSRCLGPMIISDECFLSFQENFPLRQYSLTHTKFMSGALFHGTVVPHSGGNNRLHYRPALQAFVSVENLSLT
jgi:hypothetical protein